jgi:phosphatidylglycerophosphate synthase
MTYATCHLHICLMILIFPLCLLLLGDVNGLYMTFFSSHLDWVDGFIARRLDACSEFGNFLDKTCDKIRHASQGYVLVYYAHAMEPWMLYSLLLRDIIIDVLRYMPLHGGTTIPLLLLHAASLIMASIITELVPLMTHN